MSPISEASKNPKQKQKLQVCEIKNPITSQIVNMFTMTWLNLVTKYRHLNKIYKMRYLIVLMNKHLCNLFYLIIPYFKFEVGQFAKTKNKDFI